MRHLAMLAVTLFLVFPAHARKPPPKPPPPVHVAIFAPGAAPTKDAQCRPLAEVALLCLTTPYTGRAPLPRDILRARSDTWAQVAARVPVRKVVDLLPERVVEGAGTYTMTNVGDGFDHAPLLDPAALVARFGREVRVAVPDQRTLVAWSDQGGTFDKLMGVGVWKLHDAASRGEPDPRPAAAPVSAVVLRWSGDAWEEVGVASRAPDAPPSRSDTPGGPADGHP
jgi:hypothetical protein